MSKTFQDSTSNINSGHIYISRLILEYFQKTPVNCLKKMYSENKKKIIKVR